MALFTGTTRSISSEALQCIFHYAAVEHCHTLDKIFIKLWAGPTVEASSRETVVYQSIEKVLFVGAIHNMSALSNASMDRVIPWIELLNSSTRSLINVAMVEIQMAAWPDVQHKDPPALGYLCCWSKW